MSVFMSADIARSREISWAAIAAMYVVASDSPIGAVVDSVFFRSFAGVEIRRLDGNVVEVFCRCDRQVAAQRYATSAGDRLVGHFDSQRTAEELWNDENAVPVAAGWPVIEVDTTGVVDLESLARQILAATSGPRPHRAMTPSHHSGMRLRTGWSRKCLSIWRFVLTH